MSSHTRGPRKRKSRPAAGRAREAQPIVDAAGASGRTAKSRRGDGKAARAGAPLTHSRPGMPASSAFGERPHAPWHPLPLSELLILAGAIGAAIGLSRGFSGRQLMLAGVAAVALGTIEVTLREHRSGFRSHTLLLSLLPVVVLHTTAVLLVAAFTSAPAWLNAGLLPLDAVLFLGLFKLLRGHFLDARARAVARR